MKALSSYCPSGALQGWLAKTQHGIVCARLVAYTGGNKTMLFKNKYVAILVVFIFFFVWGCHSFRLPNLRTSVHCVLCCEWCTCTYGCLLIKINLYTLFLPTLFWFLTYIKLILMQLELMYQLFEFCGLSLHCYMASNSILPFNIMIYMYVFLLY